MLLVQFFWTPFLAEKNFVKAGNGFSTSDYFVRFPKAVDLVWSNWSWGGFENSDVGSHFTHRIGIIFFLIIATIFIKNKKNKLTTMEIFLTLVFITSCFLLTKYSKLVWDIIWPIQSVQFPWRILWVPVFTACLIFLESNWSQKVTVKWRIVGGIVIMATIIHHLIFYAKPAGYIQNSNHTWLQYPYTTTSNGEFDPIWFDAHKNLKLTEIVVGRAKGQNLYHKDKMTGLIPIEYKQKAWTGSEMVYEITATQSAEIIQKTAYFPGWKVIVDNTETPIIFDDPEFPGRITFAVDSGKHAIKVKYTAYTWDRFLGYALSSLGMIILVTRLIKRDTIMRKLPQNTHS
jgi:hypothetical protein